MDIDRLTVEARAWQNHGPTSITAEVKGRTEQLAECSGFGHKFEDNLAVARRISACWNVCQDIHVDALELCGRTLLDGEVAPLSQQNAELLDTLQRIRDTVEDYGSMTDPEMYATLRAIKHDVGLVLATLTDPA